MKWINKLNNQGYITINRFLSDDIANALRKKILRQSALSKSWELLTTPYYPYRRVKNRINKPLIDHSRHQQAVNAHRRKVFAFSFYRSSNKDFLTRSETDSRCLFLRHLNNEVTHPLIALHSITDIFYASFIKGQFIGYHSDATSGKYGFVYQLSKGWRKSYGGQLILYPKQLKFYKKIIEPQFNSLTILKLDHPMFHSVETLRNPSHKYRLTISGWIE